MKRYKILDNRPVVSDEAVNQTMDFDGLLSKHTEASLGSSFGLMKSLAITGVVLLLGYLTVVYFFIRENEISASETPVASEVAKPQVEVEKNEIIARENTVEEKDSPKEEAKSEALDQKKPPKVDKAPIAPEKVSLEQKEDSKASEYVYLEAEPLNGIASLYEYFDETLTYPVEALKDSIQGVTLVTFTINTAGRAEKIIIEKSLGPLFDKEAIRVLDGMQEWRPASINGQSIDSKVSIPLTFRIEK